MIKFTIVVALVSQTCMICFAEKLSINTDLLSKIRSGKENNYWMKVNGSFTTIRKSNLVWQITVTKTAPTTDYTPYQDTIDPYHQMTNLMMATFQNEKCRQLILGKAKEDYQSFMVGLKLQGPEAFVESLSDTGFFLYSDLMQKKKEWTDNWLTILQFFDLLGKDGFTELMKSIGQGSISDPTLGPALESNSTGRSTYWVPTEPWVTENNYVDEVVKRITIEPLNETTERTTTPSTPIIILGSTLSPIEPVEVTRKNISSEEPNEFPTQGNETIEEELQEFVQDHYARRQHLYNTVNENATVNLDDQVKKAEEDIQNRYYYGEVEQTAVTEREKRILTHKLKLEEVTSTTMRTTKLSSPTEKCSIITQLTETEYTIYPTSAERNGTKPTRLMYAYKLLSKTPTPLWIKYGRNTPSHEDSTMAYSADYEVCETPQFHYYDILTPNTEKKNWRYKYTLPPTNATGNGKPTRKKMSRKLINNSTSRLMKHKKLTNHSKRRSKRGIETVECNRLNDLLLP